MVLTGAGFVASRFQREFSSPGTLQLRRPPSAQPRSVCDQFVAQGEALRAGSPHLSEEELFQAATDALRAAGVSLRRPGAAAGDGAEGPSTATAAPVPEKELLRVADLFDEQKPAEKS